MLKIRVIPVLTFNGFALVKTRQFSNPRMVGNPIQSTRVFNSRGVDELAFIDIFASKQKRNQNLALIKEIISECYMPVAIGGGIKSLDDINDLLKSGADKVIIKSEALCNPGFVKEASRFYGSQCITIAADCKKVGNDYMIYADGNSMHVKDFVTSMQDNGAGEFIITSVDNDGMMNGFDINLIQYVEKLTSLPLIAVGGGGEPGHYQELFSNTNIEAVGSASIFYFTQYTPLDIKKSLHEIGKPVRI